MTEYINEDAPQIKDELKEQREKKRMTNQNISDMSGLPLNTVTNYFSSRSKAPSVYTVGPLCAALGVSLDKYFGIVQEPCEQAESESEELIKKLEEKDNLISQLLERIRIYKKICNILSVIVFCLLIACAFIAFCYPIRLA